MVARPSLPLPLHIWGAQHGILSSFGLNSESDDHKEKKKRQKNLPHTSDCGEMWEETLYTLLEASCWAGVIRPQGHLVSTLSRPKISYHHPQPRGPQDANPFLLTATVQMNLGFLQKPSLKGLIPLV